MSTPQERRRILMLVTLHAGTVSGKTKLQKLVYLVQRESDAAQLRDVFHFEPYLYGPFSQDISREVDQLERDQLLARSQYLYSQKGQTMATASCQLTEKGKAEALAIHAKWAAESEAVQRVVEKYRFETLPRILDHVYSAYPESAVNAKRDQA